MNRSMITATNTMTQLQKQLDTISHNISNVNTNGFKSREISFQELLFQQFNNQPIEKNEVGRVTPNGIRQGVGAKVSNTSLNQVQGTITTTDRSLDVALLKENQFFEIEVEGIIQYTRDGSFSLSALPNGDTQLVTSEGHPVLSETGRIIIGEGITDFQISETGELTVSDESGNSNTFNLSVVQIKRPQLLNSVGNNAFTIPDLQALGLQEADVFALLERNEIAVKQGVLEQSNVDLQKQMTDMIQTQRSYQFAAKSISIADQMLGLVNGIR